MKTTQKAVLAASLIGLAYLASKKAIGALPGTLGGLGGQLSLPETSEMVRYTLATDNFPDVTPLMLGTVIEIESARKPMAIRAEPGIEDFSVGMTQTLVKTARNLHDQGWDQYPRPDHLNFDYAVTDPRRVTESPARILTDPRASIYYGAAALQDLYWYNGGPNPKTDEWIIRAYNGGPKYGPTSSSTAHHWEKYQVAEDRVRPWYTGSVQIVTGNGGGF